MASLSENLGVNSLSIFEPFRFIIGQELNKSAIKRQIHNPNYLDLNDKLTHKIHNPHYILPGMKIEAQAFEQLIFLILTYIDHQTRNLNEKEKNMFFFALNHKISEQIILLKESIPRFHQGRKKGQIKQKVISLFNIEKFMALEPVSLDFFRLKLQTL